MTPYDAVLVVSFGGPEKRDDVIPFLENVLRGKNVPHERMLEVAEHYYHFGGKSPINEQNRALIQALKELLAREGPNLPIYWGNRNWHPLLADTLRQMREDGIQRALAFFTSAYSSYSGCRQYREDIARAQQEVGDGAPQVDKIRVFYNHPGFIDPMIENVRHSLDQIPQERRAACRIAFTAHSIPDSMASTSDYVAQLREASRLVAGAFPGLQYELVYQSRSGPPNQPWLEPDIVQHLKQLAAVGVKDVIVVPIGFISDHLEVLFDLDTEARKEAEELNINMIRAATVGKHPEFIQMIRELIVERLEPTAPRRFLGNDGVRADVCAADCCPRPEMRRPAAAQPTA